MDVVYKYTLSGVRNFILFCPTDKIRRVFLFTVLQITSASTRNMGRGKEIKHVLISYKIRVIDQDLLSEVDIPLYFVGTRFLRSQCC